MINYHPSENLLQAYICGDLPASLSAAISMHAQMCEHCQAMLASLTEQAAERVFELNNSPATAQRGAGADAYIQPTIEHEMDSEIMVDFEQMMADITSSDQLDMVVPVQPQTITFQQQEYVLPQALHHIARGNAQSLGKLTRTRLLLDEREVRANLLHLAPGGSVPAHSHKGFELTLLLAGSFSDEHGDYQAGDFILLNQQDQHQPFSEQGCLCYTVANNGLHFTQGINKLLNPITGFIY